MPNKILFSFILLFGCLSQLNAFQSYPDENLTCEFNEKVSLQEICSHGEVKPSFDIQLKNISVQLRNRKITWLAHTTSWGVMQTWGEPLLDWPEAISLRKMDLYLRQLVDENISHFKVRSQELIFDREHTKYSGPFRYVTYQRVVRLNDVLYPVEDAFMTFRFHKNHLIEITNYTLGEIPPLEEPMVTKEEAVQIALEDSLFDPHQDRVGREVGVKIQPYSVRKNEVRFRFVFHVNVRKQKPQGLWRYSIHGASGEIVKLTNQLYFAGHVMGEIYSRLPSQDLQTVPLQGVFVRSGSETAESDAEGIFEFDPFSATAFLSGRRADVRRYPDQKIQKSSADGENILFLGKENLSENMTYFHVHRLSRFVNQFFGNFKFFEKPIRVFTRVQHPVILSCNAWYDPEIKSLNFLEGDERCYDSSHIADIIYHEWGHALDDALGGIQDGSFSEGIGDITTLLMTGDSKIGPEFLKKIDQPIRNISILKIYPRDRHSNPHVDSLIISGAWYEAFLRLKEHYGAQEGRSKTAELFFKHLVSTDNYLDSYMGALLVDDDDGDLSNCTPHMCLLNPAFARRGLTKYDPRCISDDASLKPCADSTIRR